MKSSRQVAPPTAPTTISGLSGAFTLGEGLSLAGRVLSATPFGFKDFKKYYGAVGNGSTLDSQALIDALSDGTNLNVFVPPGNYLLDDATYPATKRNKQLVGSGMFSPRNYGTNLAGSPPYTNLSSTSNFITPSTTKDVIYAGSDNVTLCGFNINQLTGTTRTSGSNIQHGPKNDADTTYESYGAHVVVGGSIFNIGTESSWVSLKLGQHWDLNFGNLFFYNCLKNGIVGDFAPPYGGSYATGFIKIAGKAGSGGNTTIAASVGAGVYITQADVLTWICALNTWRTLHGIHMNVATGKTVGNQKFSGGYFDNVIGGYGVKMEITGTGICTNNDLIGFGVNTGNALGSYSVGTGCTDNGLAHVKGIYGSLGTPVNNGTRTAITDCR